MRPTSLRPLLAISLFGVTAVAQPPSVGIVDYYGVRHLSLEKLRKQVALNPGDAMPASKADLEERLESINGVVRAEVTAHCCEAGKTILYIGIEEKGAPHFDYNDAPSGETLLPDYVVENYRSFLPALNRAAARGEAAEDLSLGHSLMANSEVRAFQERFVIHAELYLDRLKQVLRTGSDAEHRAIAAHLLGYARNKRIVIDDLQFALRDPDETVRGNSLRALAAIAVLAEKDKELGIQVSPTWIVEMLHSINWNDRYRAAQTLVRLTGNREPGTIGLLRERGAAEISEMALWKHLTHALAPFFLAGRMAGMDEKAIEEAWISGDRQQVVSRLSASLSTSSKR
jgi:hypothetical protein